jgi:hypothetical protein
MPTVIVELELDEAAYQVLRQFGGETSAAQGAWVSDLLYEQAERAREAAQGPKERADG